MSSASCGRLHATGGPRAWGLADGCLQRAVSGHSDDELVFLYIVDSILKNAAFKGLLCMGLLIELFGSKQDFVDAFRDKVRPLASTIANKDSATQKTIDTVHKVFHRLLNLPLYAMERCSATGNSATSTAQT